MNRRDWIFALFFIVLGFLCMMMSASYLTHHDTVRWILSVLFRTFVWIFIPVSIIGIVYNVIKRRR